MNFAKMGVPAKMAIRVALAGLTLLLISLPLLPQANQGTIQGNVFDQSGGAIAGATVTVIDVARGVSRPLTTDTAGAYLAANLIPGNYTVRGSANGFQTLEHANVAVEVGESVRVDLVLQPGQQTQTVTVTSEAPAINTTDTTLGGTLNQQTLDELPMNGRNFKSVTLLRPAITQLPGTAAIFWSANGSRTEDIGYLIGGLRADEAYNGNSAVNSTTPLGDDLTNFPVDAIQEMNTEENPKAELGWKPGAIVNIGIKSGTNSLHGTAFAYGYDQNWNARNYFNVPPLPKPPLTLEQFGGNAGGPIKKDKLFWFADYEGQRYAVGQTLPLTSPATVSLGTTNPTTVTQSLVNACQDLNTRGVKISPLSAQIAGLNTTTCAVAPPNYSPGSSESFFPTNTGTGSVILGLQAVVRQDDGVAKIDYNINDHNTINGMFFSGDGVAIGGGGSTGALFFYGLPGSSNSPFGANDGARSLLASGAWNWTPSSTKVNELRIGYTHFHSIYQSEDSHVNPLAYGIDTGATDPRIFGFPAISITGFTGTTGGGQYKVVGPDGSLQFLDHYSLVHGNHTFKLGGELIYNGITSYQNNNGKGVFKFANIESFLQGTVNSTGNAILAGDPTRHLHNEQYALFFQDDWRVTRRVMLNLGLRWEYDSVLKESDDLLGGFRRDQGLVQVGKQIGTPYNGDFKDFSPRVGVAWDVRGDGKTVLRAGGSVMYTYLPVFTFLALGQQLGISQTPTGARVITQATGPAGVAGTGNMGVISETVPGSSLTPGWQAQTAACVTGGTTACGSIFPQSIFNIQCGDGRGTDPGPCIAPSVDPNLHNARIATWTVGLQRAITNNLSLDASYVGTHGDDIADYIDINQPPYGSGFTAAQIAAGDPSVRSATLEQQARPFYSQYPYLSYIDQLTNVQRSNYNALQATLTERTSHGLSFLAGYTYEHALDSGTSYNMQTLPVDSIIPLDYGNSDNDIRHRFTFVTNYALPSKRSPGQLLEGWALNSVVIVQSRLPWSPRDTTNDFAGNGEVINPSDFGSYWNFSGNRSDFDSSLAPIPCWRGSSTAALPAPCSLGSAAAGNPAPAACLAAASAISANTVAILNKVGCYVRNQSALFPAALGTVGDVGRNTFRGAPFQNWDLSVTKSWKFTERFGAQFRAEFFNILNHPNFTVSKFITATIGQVGNFGCNCITPDQSSGDVALGSGGSRKMQLAMRFTF